MSHTPAQARELWCPMVRIARHEVTEQRQPIDKGSCELVVQKDHIVAGCNTDALGSLRVPASCRCIADECAMWRWAESFDSLMLRRGMSQDEAAKAERARRRGYCGLAGAPTV